MADARKIVSDAIEGEKEPLRSIAHQLWSNPELAYKEKAAHKLLTDYLESKGFKVDRSYCDIETAFRARFGSGSPHVCVICEYDALPEIGHACGHNLIAAAGLGAGVAIKAYLESSGTPGTLTVLGTPAEEGGGGKVLLMDRGAFNDFDIAIMVHPAPVEIIVGYINARVTLSVEFTGKAAHAAAFPWEGVNALDAAVLAYTNVSLLRQQMKPTWRVHAVFTNGGTKPNIIPEKASLLYYVRAPNLKELGVLRGKVTSCFESAATATGCTVEIKENDVSYTDLHSNPVLAGIYRKHIEASGTEYTYDANASWSTDMGNVSYVVPSLHPTFAIGSGEVNHTREFAAVTDIPESHTKTRVTAVNMALTCIDVLKGGEELVKEIKEKFVEQVGTKNN
ncbi:PREDICTED: peptidase M20 domain-containing protein 2-like [Amphimedon queenslandica]|uniref:Peptidase M20 domain-containing protein 2 n=1 Tax=Amphimedon queenslandica TaxID=400682 RepID=A0A1X7UPE9_AMPQE|nr:PREDICTED: peptidase M20 domain-containing protein 2-like [Amphimedon queenslandica]|eukprot:XP_019852998.1 PREDICTED: peptidase M20 domain-containing protein 2-like [Amphimedon queenslandica]